MAQGTVTKELTAKEGHDDTTVGELNAAFHCSAPSMTGGPEACFNKYKRLTGSSSPEI